MSDACNYIPMLLMNEKLEYWEKFISLIPSFNPQFFIFLLILPPSTLFSEI